MRHILVVEDDPSHAELIRRAFAGREDEYALSVTSDLTNARAHVESRTPDLVLSDCRLPDGEGLELVGLSAERFPVVLMTAYLGERQAVDAVKAGALDYIVKSPGAFSVMPDTVTRALREWQLLAESKRAAIQLREASLFNESIIACAEEGIIVYGSDLRYQVWNPYMERISGLPARDVLGKRPSDLFPFLIQADIETRVKTVLSGQSVDTIEFPYALPQDGRSGWSSDAMAPLRNAKGGITGVIGMVRDITERKQLEQTLQSALERLRFHLENTPLAAIEFDSSYRVVAWSKTAQTIFGWTAEEIAGKRISEIRWVHEDDEKRVAALSADMLTSRVDSNVHVNRNYRKDGSIITCEWYNSVLRGENEGEFSVFSLVLDVTERERLGEQLRQAQKMEAVGQLAGGIAHDFNNLLQSMTMNVEILQAHLEADDIAREAIEEVDRAAQRAADLVRQLLAFSRRQTIQLAALNLNDRIEDALKLIRRVLGEHIELRFSPGGALQSTLADKGQVEQILMNLCVNARDAMPEGGALSIETGNAVFDRVFLCDNPWAAEGQYVFVRVSDTGHGMDTETLEHIFDPFFTTKEIGKGTGLGLASVYGIVKQHKGFIRVTSTPDRGTSFWVFFPVADAVPAKDSAAPKRFASGGRETILLAEDEPMLLGLLSRILSAAGYTVLTACDGQEALRIFENNADAIHLVMCDVVMPGMNGRAVMERIKARRPDVSFVFSSGYSAEAIQSDFVLDKGLRFIQKPYRHGDLLRIVRETLDTAERNPD